MKLRRFPVALKFPRKYDGVVFVIAQRLSISGLMFLSEMRAGRLVAFQRVDAHEFSKLQEIGNASGAFQGLIEIAAVSRNADFMPELFSQFGNFSKRFAQSFFVARHSASVPKKQAKLSMERIDRPRAVDVEKFFNPVANALFRLLKLCRIRRWPFSQLAGEIIWQRVWQ